MSDVHSHDDHDEGPHEGPIKTPKQLIVAVLFAFIVPIALIVLLVSYVGSGSKPAAGSTAFTDEAIAKRLQPVGMAEFKDFSDPSAARTGEQVYTAVCAACHAAGLAGAPKFADKAAWAPRIETGYEALLKSALQGKGAMGPQGGGDFSDYEIGRAVVHMANAAGAKFPEPEFKAPDAQTAGAPAAVTAAPAPAAAASAAGADAAQAVAAANASAASAPEAASAPAASAGGGAPPALYTQVCQVCHAVGVAGAPKTGDKAAWAPLVALGVDELTQVAIKGKNAMPPRGGSSASDEEIRAVVTYMVNQVK